MIKSWLPLAGEKSIRYRPAMPFLCNASTNNEVRYVDAICS